MAMRWNGRYETNGEGNCVGDIGNLMKVEHRLFQSSNDSQSIGMVMKE